jgi:hypothetical protein
MGMLRSHVCDDAHPYQTLRAGLRPKGRLFHPWAKGPPADPWPKGGGIQTSI